MKKEQTVIEKPPKRSENVWKKTTPADKQNAGSTICSGCSAKRSRLSQALGNQSDDLGVNSFLIRANVFLLMQLQATSLRPSHSQTG